MPQMISDYLRDNPDAQTRLDMLAACFNNYG